jgi:hypothetical protein
VGLDDLDLENFLKNGCSRYEREQPLTNLLRLTELKRKGVSTVGKAIV